MRLRTDQFLNKGISFKKIQYFFSKTHLLNVKSDSEIARVNDSQKVLLDSPLEVSDITVCLSF
jgi:hypothetical protein